MTLTAVRPKQRYGVIKIEKNKVTYFDNENRKAETYVNCRYFVLSKEAKNKIESFKKLKVLVIGETIIDQYVFCSALGK